MRAKRVSRRAAALLCAAALLVNLISKRERELINGAKPLVRPTSLDEDKCDIALREVAEGKLIAEIDFDSIAKAEEAKTKWNAKHINVNSLFAD